MQSEMGGQDESDIGSGITSQRATISLIDSAGYDDLPEFPNQSHEQLSLNCGISTSAPGLPSLQNIPYHGRYAHELRPFQVNCSCWCPTIGGIDLSG